MDSRDYSEFNDENEKENEKENYEENDKENFFAFKHKNSKILTVCIYILCIVSIAMALLSMLPSQTPYIGPICAICKPIWPYVLLSIPFVLMFV